MVLGKLPGLGRPTIWMTVGLTALAVGAGGVVWTFFFVSGRIRFIVSSFLPKDYPLYNNAVHP